MIHYHGTPFSGVDLNHLALQAKHAMVSFAAPGHIATIAELCQTFCLDNGAFSAWKKGDKLDVDGFLEWAAIWLKHPGCDFAVIPDVIDGSEKENDDHIRWIFGFFDNETMVRFKWVPVWHLHESIDRLVRLVEEWPRVALGSSGDFATIGNKKWWDRISVAMDVITDYEGFPVTKLHGLRMLDPGLSSYIPFSSADSCNTARNLGIDVRWNGPYAPASQRMRAAVIAERIEHHACAAKWHKGFCVKQANFDLIG